MNKNVGSALSARRWMRSAGYAWAGLQRTYRQEANFRFEAWAAVTALGLTLWLDAPLTPILLVCALVLSLELVNSAVEAAIDLLSPGPHPLAAAAKDAAAGAVYVAAFFALLVGLNVLGPPLWALVSGR
ncbi:diacylglycerol kinase [Deinococcus radiophilus]|uniref:Diacylglycerol kinase n=1 Tax=Deinococcus radiophilus TaxID=32062 RepID=A0A3S0IJ75_9DEIO|nr:diacylglycerol kinase [Deinococcus radiophilus]RTR25247.1 diacylglycerol kinase [Deinococcus radiophilus]UFA50270.1 diacylglycerol kinase [Deinococcus radiophilus]